MDIDDVISVVLMGAAVVVFSFFLYVLFAYLPMKLYAEAECLREGYPKAHVSIGLERYCSNFDGAVTIQVDRQSED